MVLACSNGSRYKEAGLSKRLESGKKNFGIGKLGPAFGGIELNGGHILSTNFPISK
jgi:hypothetical protein